MISENLKKLFQGRTDHTGGHNEEYGKICQVYLERAADNNLFFISISFLKVKSMSVSNGISIRFYELHILIKMDRGGQILLCL